MVVPHNTEDKQWWCEYGLERERMFIEKVAPRLGLSAAFNPEKVAGNKYAPDLIVEGRLADLKAEQTPFFTARYLFNIDPQYAYTFNRKDYLRYREFYPELDIYVWLDWRRETQWNEIRVRPMVGIYCLPFSEIARRIESGTVKLHTYKRRTADGDPNAKDSYGFDIRTFKVIRQVFCG